MKIAYRSYLSCIIATAAYGSEMHPDVLQMRSFRDNKVATSFTGNNFLKVFLAWYYSWSPPVARVISENEPLKNLFRIVLTPLTYTMKASEQIYSVFSFSNELAASSSILSAALLCGVFYLSPLFTVIKLNKKISFDKRLVIILLASTCLTTIVGWLVSSWVVNTFGIVSMSVIVTVLSGYYTLIAISYLTKSARASLSARAVFRKNLN